MMNSIFSGKMSFVLRGKSTLNRIHKRLLTTETVTIDNQEIKQFQKYTSEWWNKYGPTKGLHSMNQLRVPFVRDGLINEGAAKREYVDTSAPLTGLSILDIGCGGGILSEALARLGACVTGIDANSDIIDLAKQHAQKNNLDINYIFTSIDDYAQENLEKHDAVCASEILEHVSEKEKFLIACAKCLKPSGSIFITTLNKTFVANLFAIYATENILQLVPRGTHHIEKFIEPHKVQRLLEDCNVHTRLIHGMTYNILTNKWHWCSNTSINYALQGVKLKEVC